MADTMTISAPSAGVAYTQQARSNSSGQAAADASTLINLVNNLAPTGSKQAIPQKQNAAKRIEAPEENQ
jgi:hypothetical protein